METKTLELTRVEIIILQELVKQGDAMVDIELGYSTDGLIGKIKEEKDLLVKKIKEL